MTIGPKDQEIPDSVLARSLRKSAGFSVTAHAFTNSITNGSLYEKNGGGEETGPPK
jgi:MSHA pilin protein MshA